ncbi:hypothetical protein TRFO_26156 [Tritrichomonas foetus]|uniref:VWFA domain-containing protein n=1 Tax=Tritrichomonas foetus TaxID=1144522 RepID=A0A1J4K507_9EUKA|nr:hypothetical protein TRFO_26156 [Tritrichomonas foetus]|eukprot:OHT05944.1 hypothetical protein TRFO_26156 [Tritrichomonas foetus]
MTVDSSKLEQLNSEPFDEKLMDVLFIIDATGSMGFTLSAAHDRAASMAAKLKNGHPELDFQFGAICFRDPIDSPNDEHNFIDLHSDINEIIKFLSSQEPKGGGDEPEDWVGAFDIALKKISWRNGSRLSIIIADAPAHGKIYCGFENHEDQAPLLGPLVIEFAKRKILISGLSINNGANQTFDKIKEIYEGANGPKFTIDDFYIGYAYQMRREVKRDQLGRDIEADDYPKDDPDDEQYDCDSDMEGVPPRKTRPPPIDDSVDEKIVYSFESETTKESAEEIIASKFTSAALDLVSAALEKN